MQFATGALRHTDRALAVAPDEPVFLANREALLSELSEVKAALERAEQCVRDGDGQGLYDFLERAALARRFWGSRSGLS